jgi:nicotinamide-nucleotide amidase
MPAGASSVFQGSVVAYANEVKEEVIGVPQETMVQYGAVSEETVTRNGGRRLRRRSMPIM